MKRFTAAVIAANVLLCVLIVYANQLILSLLGGSNPLRIIDVSLFSITVTETQVGSSPIPTVAWSIPNYPVYIFLLALAVNAVFAVQLLAGKKQKVN